ncbi:MAG: polyphosphate polymerase domain-containing protein [Chloroflexota bacterium]|nr:polyphosphate polymerase domain-containing protein [Chloroflexota bacterium]
MSNAIRKFNRFELKYLLSWEDAERLKQDLEQYLQPDTYGDSRGAYALSSLYYDTADYCFYWEKVEGIKFRRKLRIRHYEGRAALTPETQVFVEVKQRLNRVTQKRRVLLPYRDALELCNHRTIPQHAPRDRAVIAEIHAMTWQYNLRPTCITSYMRQAFVGSDYDIGLRVTFDTNIRYRAKDLQLHSKKIGSFMLSPQRVIMEIKVNERVPYWITELVAEHNFALIRISKYCTSLKVAARVPNPSYHFA